MRALGIEVEKDELRKMITAVDANGSGHIEVGRPVRPLAVHCCGKADPSVRPLAVQCCGKASPVLWDLD